tara:strand:- start:211 stop:462 length:252 start_codon:yes stop_codon:yes gene_type:complete
VQTFPNLIKKGKTMPKLTNKERDQQLRWLTGQIQNMNSLFASYVEWRGLSADFQKHIIDLNEKIKKKAQDDTSADNKVDSKEG